MTYHVLDPAGILHTAAEQKPIVHQKENFSSRSLIVYIHETIGHEVEIAHTPAPSPLETRDDRCIDPTDLTTNPHRAPTSERVLPAGLSVQPACRRSSGYLPEVL